MDFKTPSNVTIEGTLNYPFEIAPQADEVIEVRPGVLWVRLPLPFRLNHVNVYLLADHDGWTMIDTGIGNETTIAAWIKLFEGPLRSIKITRLIVTHAHPDHIGLAGWIVERFNCSFHMSQVEYLQGAYYQQRGSEERKQAQRAFFRRHGMDDVVADQLLNRGQDYLKRVSVLPASYHRLSQNDDVAIGSRRFKIITGGGHSFDQVMLYCADDKLFLAADQVLSKISPNVSVWAFEPHANALGEYLTSLAALDRMLPADVLVLPSHGLPFFGVKTRIKQLADHHEERCQLIAKACRIAPQTSAQLVPVVFHKHRLDAHQTGFAAGEVIAHVNYMLAQGRLQLQAETGDILRFSAT